MGVAHKVDYDVEGYLIDPNDWNESIATALATKEGIDLDSSYWPLLHFMRAYWLEHRVIPDVRHVVDFFVNEQGLEKKAAKQHLFNLFPYGYVKQACKIAGMQRPRAWSTG
ncbi:MAG: TusE/DsrC/DsvC family sulfur relay protein [Gammaproteobacteria bacterium]|nr:TusE/DsrC/DsvC family sulfur relay protein [Gammaproteobacteria bacterium]